jgi:hypothetical protein
MRISAFKLGTAAFWRMTVIVIGWTIFAGLAGLVGLTVFGVVPPPQGYEGYMLWIHAIKALIWPAAGHALAAWIKDPIAAEQP